MAFPSKLLNEGEHVVVSTRTHPKVLLFPLLIGVLVLAVAAFLSRLGEGDAADIAHIGVWIVAALAIVWWVVRAFIDWATTWYTFTNRRFIKRSGLVAKEGRTIPLNRISGVDFEIGVIDRIFGCGTLVVSDASEQGRVELEDIPRVEEVQLKVAEELHSLADRQHRADDGT
ncbi:MAG: PH domain-containing protein [Aeromicrobium sp.]